MKTTPCLWNELFNLQQQLQLEIMHNSWQFKEFELVGLSCFLKGESEPCQTSGFPPHVFEMCHQKVGSLSNILAVLGKW